MVQTEVNESCPVHGTRARQETKTSDSEVEQLKQQVRDLSAQVLFMQNEQRKAQLAQATGIGMLKPVGADLSKEDYASVKDERIAEASLEEIARLDAEMHGIDVSNEREFSAYIGDPDVTPSMSQVMARSRQ